MKKVLQLLTLTTLLATPLSAVLAPIHQAMCVHHVIRAGNLARVEKMIKENPALVHATNNVKWTPLHVAAVNGFTEIARLLLTYGADLNTKDDRGLTPLHNAAAFDNVETVAFLLEAGADASVRDNVNNETPLDLARVHNYTEMIECFVMIPLLQSLRKFSASEIITVR